MTDRDDSNNKEVGGSDVRLISTAARSDKHQARPPTDHFKRLLEDCGMMRSFMTSWSLTWGAELDEGPDRNDTMLFPKENVIMMVYGGCP
jgi:hypothetical protein